MIGSSHRVGGRGPGHQETPKASAAVPMSDGVVRKIDKVTIKHGPLQNLAMPPMTMVFRVKDPAMLDRMKEGDTIKFVADKVDGAFTLTRIEVVP